ncbi:hypothetical protein GF420_12890 [candidate division GN15 bacterium]|nr:hypothetical protein [candidate division GN15 bacterium]
MDNLELLGLAVTFLSGNITVPIVAWLKSNWLKDVPIQSLLITIVFNIAIAYGVGYLLGLPEWTVKSAIVWVATTQAGSQLGHTIKKSIRRKRERSFG